MTCSLLVSIRFMVKMPGKSFLALTVSHGWCDGQTRVNRMHLELGKGQKSLA